VSTSQDGGALPGPPGPASLTRELAASGGYRALLGETGGGPVSSAEQAGRRFSLRLLLRFKWTILLLFALSAPAGVLLVRIIFIPQYTATALLEVYSVVPRLVVETDETGPITQYERYVQTQADIMRSLPVLERVLERRDVQQTTWFHEPPPLVQRWMGTVPQPVERLAEALSAAPRKRTELLEITVTTRQPRDSAVLANALLDEYLKFARERFSEKDRALYDALTEEQQKLASEIGFLERVVAETRRELLSPSPDDLIAQRRIRLDQYEAELRRLELDIDVTRQELAELEATTASQPANGTPLPTARYQRDPEWRRLYGQWKEVEQRLTEAAAQFGDSHPTMVRLRQTREAAQAALEARQRELDDGGAVTTLAGTTSGARPGEAHDAATLRYQLRLWELRRQRVAREVEELRSAFQNEFAASERLRQKTAELEKNKERLAAVLRRLEELAEKTKVPASIRVISRAVPPSLPKDNKRMKLTIAAIVGALATGLFGAYLRLRFSPQVQDAHDVSQAAPAAFWWELPLATADGGRELPESPAQTEAVRMIRTALLGRLTRERGNTVQITSAGPGSGKSTLALRLAHSLASCGKNVLLVEADRYHPGLAQRFGLDPARGLAGVLAGRCPLVAAVHATATPGLSILPSGRDIDPTCRELLANGAFAALLSEWRRNYDFIVFDSPPLLLTADASILAGHADGTLMVVRERHCRRDEVVEAYAKLSLAGGRLLGTAFVASTLGRRYGYGYGYPGGTLSATAAPAEPSADNRGD